MMVGHLFIVLVKLLLNDQRIDINKVSDGWTPFYVACLNGRIEIVKLLLNDQRVDINKTNRFGETPFGIACFEQHTDVVKLLLNDQRLDVNKAEKYNRTPFCIVCRYGHIEIVKYLLACRREIDINQKDGDGKTGLDIARNKGNVEKKNWDNEEDFKNKKRNYLKIVELIESFERNQNETRIKLRIELGFAGKFIYSYHYFNYLSLLNKLIFVDIDAVSLFAIIVLLSDQFLDFRHN